MAIALYDLALGNIKISIVNMVIEAIHLNSAAQKNHHCLLL